MPTQPASEQVQPDLDDVVFLDDGRRAELPGFDPYFSRWIEQLREQHKSPSTVSTYVQALPPCVATLQSVASTDVTVQTISLLEPTLFEQMQRRMHEEGARDRTIKLRMAALRSFGRFLHQCGCARCDKLLLSRHLDFGQRQLHTPQADDCNHLVEIITSDQLDAISWEMLRDRAILRSISRHSLTTAEVLAIDRGHLCFAERKLSVVSRLRPRRLLLETEVIEDIVAYLDACPYEIENYSPLFCGSRGERLSARAVQLATEALRDQLGLHEETTPRRIRKSRILQLAASGMSTSEIIRQVGLSALAIGAILREAPLNPLELEEAVRKANTILLSLRSRATERDQSHHPNAHKSDSKSNIPKSEKQRRR